MAALSQPSACIVFGASGGIGSATARLLAANGWKLLLSARDKSRLSGLATELAADHVVADATSATGVEAVFAAAKTKLGCVNGVVSCVGSILLKPAHTTTEAEWSDVLATNLTSSFLISREAASAMHEAGGSMVFVSSVAAGRGLANHEAIAAAKAGVEGLVRAAAATYARSHIRFNAVAPGLVRTPLTRAITNSEAALKFSTALHALGRIGEPEDVASAIAWLLDPGQSWITGQVLALDGGMSTVQPR